MTIQYLFLLIFLSLFSTSCIDKKKHIDNKVKSKEILDSEIVQAYNRNGKVVSINKIEVNSSRDNVYKIKYYSDSKIVSALIVIPKDLSMMPKSKGFPLLIYNHGTVGLANKCAPSNNINSVLSSIHSFTTLHKERRYITLLPDYDGFNNESDHHYFTSVYAAKTVLDLVRAIKNRVKQGNLEGGILVNTDDIVITGYSQGGLVTLKTLEIAKGYAPEIKFSLGIVLAPGSDISGHIFNMANKHEKDQADGNPYFALAAIALFAVERQEMGKVDDLFEYLDQSSPISQDFYYLLTEECSNTIMEKIKGKDFTDDFMKRALKNDWSGTKWGPWFKKRIAGNFYSETPIIIVNGEEDNIVGPKEMTELYKRLQSYNNQVTQILSPIDDHASLPLAADKLVFSLINEALLDNNEFQFNDTVLAGIVDQNQSLNHDFRIVPKIHLEKKNYKGKFHGYDPETKNLRGWACLDRSTDLVKVDLFFLDPGSGVSAKHTLTANLLRNGNRDRCNNGNLKGRFEFKVPLDYAGKNVVAKFTGTESELQPSGKFSLQIPEDLGAPLKRKIFLPMER